MELAFFSKNIKHGGNNMSKALKCDRCGKFFEHKDMEEKYGNREHAYYVRTSFLMRQILI